jgi:hypothetical protein
MVSDLAKCLVMCSGWYSVYDSGSPRAKLKVTWMEFDSVTH